MRPIQGELIERMYELAYTTRLFEQKAIEQYRLGNIRGYLHPYLGEEAIAVGAITALEPDDYIVSTHRGHGHAIAKGHDPKIMMAELLGKATGYCRGRGGSMHVSHLAQYNLGANGIVGGGIPVATGAAMGIKQKGTHQVVLSFFSDGASNQGVFHESINLAAIFKLPIIYVLENNHYAVSTRIEDSALVKNLSERAAAYGIPGCTVDGNDAIEVYEAMEMPLDRARAGEGPTLIECKTFRHGGHHVNDPGLYMPKEKLDYWKSRDPVDRLKNRLLESGMDESEVQAINTRVEQLIEQAVQFALESPDPSVEEYLAELALAD
jgi:acetoin:2,6-dichlorophenolindophenol oxidoreductase subunit alpha